MKKGLILFAVLLALIGCNSHKKTETGEDGKATRL